MVVNGGGPQRHPVEGTLEGGIPPDGGSMLGGPVPNPLGANKAARPGPARPGPPGPPVGPRLSVERQFALLAGVLLPRGSSEPVRGRRPVGRGCRLRACGVQELFVETIAKDAYVYAQQGKRKTLQRKDLDNAIEAIDEFAFLEGTLD
nr:DNA polymerase epsilon subunit 4 [Anser cygnoides]